VEFTICTLLIRDSLVDFDGAGFINAADDEIPGGASAA
jgi:hypothetical protein